MKGFLIAIPYPKKAFHVKEFHVDLYIGAFDRNEQNDRDDGINGFYALSSGDHAQKICSRVMGF
jgi:hypothetical protein